MHITTKVNDFIGQSVARVAIGGTIAIMVVGAVISALVTSGFVTDPAVLALVSLFTLIVAVVVIANLASFI